MWVRPVAAAEPERDPFLSHVSAGALLGGFEEQFSPYSGQFVVRFLTASLAGKGGLDVNVYLYYSTEVWNRTDEGTLHSASLDTTDHAGGAGWQLHMGKVINPGGSGSADATSPDNPLLVMPDGSTRFLYQSSQYPGEMITEDRWRYVFNATEPGWELTATDGTVYLFQTVNGAFATTMSGVAIAQCTRITDVNGNVITIDYEAPGNITKITDTYGRTVEFSYTTFDRIRFIRIRNGGSVLREWEISYGSALLSWSHLVGTRTVYPVTELIPPAGEKWEFTTNSATISKALGAAMLKKIELPTGGVIEYVYTGIDYDVGCQSGTKVERASLSKRKELGRAVTAVTYSYSYANPGKSNATTTITDNLGLGYQETHNLIGFGAFQLNDPNLFKIGRNQGHTVSDNLQTVSESISWEEGETLSTNFRLTSAWANCNNSRAWTPVKFVKPQSITRTVTRDSTSRTTTSSNFDQYGNPTVVTEAGEASRSTSFGYFYSTANNILDTRPTLIHRSPGGIERRWYDGLGRVVRSNLNPSSPSATDGIDTTYFYDGTGNLSKTVTENGTGSFDDREVRYEAYSFGFPERDVYENSSNDVVVNRDISPLGLVNWEEDGRQGAAFRTTFSYDGLGRRTSITPPDGSATTISYALDGSLALVSRGGRTEQYTFDGFGRWISWLDAQRGDRRERFHDALGRLTQEAFFRGGVSADSHSYDAAGRLTQVLHPDFTSIGYSYGPGTVTVTDEVGKTTSLSYASFGDPDEKRLAGVTDADGKLWVYLYDGQYGRLATIDPPGTGAERVFSYQSAGGFLSAEGHPEVSGQTTYGYSPAGDALQRVRAGQTILYEYDRIGRLTRVNPPGAQHDVYRTYAGLDLETEVQNSTVNVLSSYDGAQRLTARTAIISGLGSRTANYSYDGNDRLTRTTYPSGRRVDYTYNSAGQVTAARATGEQDYVSSIGYTAAGDVASMTYGNGVVTSWSYDSRFRPTQITAGGHTLEIAYDAASNVTQWTADGIVRAFGYDNLHRLISAGGPSAENVAFTYSPTGDRLTKTVNGNADDYTYNAVQQLEEVSGVETNHSYSYDGSGRLTARDASSFSYTPLDELASSTSPSRSFAYDGYGLRVSRTDTAGTTHYVRDARGRVLAEYDSSGSLLREHVYVLGRRVVTVLASGERFFVQHDGQGSAWIVTDSTGLEVQPARNYWPFGLAAELTEPGAAAPGSAAAVAAALRSVWGAAPFSAAASASGGPAANSGSLFADGFESGCYMAWSRGFPNACEDGLVFAPEQCESGCLGPNDCAGLGFDGGTLACSSCSFDIEACYVCNDQVVEGPEECDLWNLNGESCESLGYYTGTLSCEADCTFDTSGCHNCGNQTIDPGEDCDGTDLGGQSCASLGLTGGDLACSAGCAWDLSGCHDCGNGQIEGPEQCEPGNLNGHTCQSEGFVGGTLACSGCMLDVSDCHNCGNDTIDPGETCDGSDLGSSTCQSFGFDTGALSCLPDCGGFDTSGCFDYPSDPGAAARFTGKELEEGLEWYYLGARYLDPVVGRFGVPDPGELHLENPQSFNRYAYSVGNPYKYDDPDGRIFDIILDVGFIAYDIYDIGASLARGEGVSKLQLGALGADVLSAAIPGATGGGLAVRAGGKGAKAATRAVRASTAASSVARRVAPSSRALARSLEAAGHTRPAGAAAHHIVAGKAPAAAEARSVLAKFGIDVNDASNGVFLPAARSSANPAGAAVHSPLHTNAYYDTVNELLGQATTRAEAEAVLSYIRQGLLAGGL